MSIILKQESDGSVPNPDAGKGTIYVNTSGQLAVKKPNGTVTSVGTVANVNLDGNVSNVLSGAGTWIAAGGGGGGGSSIANGTSNVNIATSNGNVTIAAAGNSVVTVTGTGANVNGYVNATTLTGSLTTAAQPNVTSVGTLTGLTSTGTINLTGASNVSLGPVGNVKITGGTNGQVLTTNGSGTLSWSNAGGGGNVDLSEITQDVTPMFSEVYDIGAADKRWYDGYFSNKIDINGAAITAQDDTLVTTSDVVVNSLLADKLLLSDNVITPDLSTRIEYEGNKGVVVINGDIDIQGDWALMPVVETIAPVPGGTPGELNTSFSPGNGFFTSTSFAVAIQSDNKIIVGGNFGSYQSNSSEGIVRINTDGSYDSTFTVPGNGFNSAVYVVAVQSDGKILAGGESTSYDTNSIGRIARINTDGSFDSTFNASQSGFNNAVRTIAIQDDGKILVGGDFSTYNGSSAPRIIRLNANGSRDTSFSFGGGFDNTVNSIVIQDNGKIVVAGAFSQYNGSTAYSIIRLNSDGSVDNSFTNSDFASQTIFTLTLQADGKILVGGQFNFVSTSNLARLNTNGSLDNSFNSGSLANGPVLSIISKADGKIIICGGITSRLIGLNSDGSADSSFNTGSGFTGFGAIVYALAIQETNQLIAVGRFQSYNGVTCNGIAKIFTIESDPVPGQTVLTTGEPGMIRYNQDVSQFQGYTTEWGPLAAGGATTLEELTDVNITSATNGQVLTYNGSAWVNQSAGGGGAITVVGTESLAATGLTSDPGNNGCYNNFFGSGAGKCATSSSEHNNFFGKQAGFCITNGFSNNFMGQCAGFQNDSGSYNNFLGAFAGCCNTSGTNNNYFGANAARCASSGSNNNFFGANTGRYNSAGNYNNFMGRSAGQNNSSGCNNNFFGRYAGRGGYGASSSHNNFFGHLAGFCTTSGCHNNFLGQCAGYNSTTGSSNNFFGQNAGFCTSFGFGNNFFGWGAGYYNRSSFNNFIGYGSGYFNTFGVYNTFVGTGAGCNNTSGGYNTFVGVCAGSSNTTGSNNLFFGRNAGSTVSGSPSGLANITTESDRIIMGNSNHTCAQIQIAWTTVSDARDKEIYGAINRGLGFLKNVNPIEFAFKDRTTGELKDPAGKRRYGFSAQDILALEGDDPVIVSTENPDQLQMTNDYLIPILVNAVKELAEQVEQLKSQLNS